MKKPVRERKKRGVILTTVFLYFQQFTEPFRMCSVRTGNAKGAQVKNKVKYKTKEANRTIG